MTAFALTPAERMELGKQAVEVHKQVLESLKTPSEIAKNLGVADYYTSGARLHDYQRSAQYVTDQVTIHQAGVRAQYEEMQKYEKYKRVLDAEDAAAFGDAKAPSMLAKLTGFDKMKDIATYFGKNNLSHLLQVAEAMQTRLSIAGQNKSNQEFAKLMGSYEKMSKDLLVIEEKMKSAIPLDKWNAMTPADQKTARALGGFPRTAEIDKQIAQHKSMMDNLGRKLYGDLYVPMPEVGAGGSSVIDVRKTAPAAAGSGIPGTPVTQGWFGDLWRALTKPRGQEDIDRYKQTQNPHSN